MQFPTFAFLLLFMFNVWLSAAAAKVTVKKTPKTTTTRKAVLPRPTTRITVPFPAPAVTTAPPPRGPKRAGAERSAGAQLVVLPSLQLNEGERVTIRCSSMYPLGVRPSSFVQISLNETISKRNVRWQLESDKLIWTNWRGDKSARKIVKMDALYTLRLDFVAKPNHHGMKILCSSDEIRNNIVRMEMSVKNKPSILDCFSNPQTVVLYKPVTVTCVVLEGNPKFDGPSIKAPGARISTPTPRKLSSTMSAFGQYITRYEWILVPESEKTLQVSVAARNDLGTNNISFALPMKVKKDTSKKLILRPTYKTLQVGDLISCKAETKTQLMIRGKIRNDYSNRNTYQELAKAYYVKKVTYRIEQRFENKTLQLKCSSNVNGRTDLETPEVTRKISPKNDRIFLDIDTGTSVRLSQKVNIVCSFLPSKARTRKLILEYSTGTRSFILVFKGSGNGTITTDDFDSRVQRLDCQNDNGLFRCRVVITKLAAEDVAANIKCKTENGDREDFITKKLELEVPPKAIIVSPRKIDAQEGVPMESRCLVRLGSPVAFSVKFGFDGTPNGRGVMKKSAIVEDMNGLQWQLLTVRQNLTLENAGRDLVCRAESKAANSTAKLPVNLQIPMRNFEILPINRTRIARGSVIRCSAEGYPKPSLTMDIGYAYSTKSSQYYFANVFKSKVTPNGGEITYVVVTPMSKDILVVCKAVQAGASVKERRAIYKAA